MSRSSRTVTDCMKVRMTTVGTFVNFLAGEIEQKSKIKRGETYRGGILTSKIQRIIGKRRKVSRWSLQLTLRRVLS